MAGISSASNLSLLTNIVQSHNLDILALQEVAFLEINVYNYNFYININSLSAKNVAFLIRKDIPVLKTICHPDGKIIGIVTEFFSLLNVHAPSGNTYKQQRESFFVTDVSCSLTDFSYPSFLMGDMNATLQDIDNTSNFNYSPGLQEVVNTFNFIDIWRSFHPHKIEYTYHHSTGASRLDIIYVPTAQRRLCSSADIIKLPLSDHCMVTLKCQFPARKHIRNTYHWKFNDTILLQDEYKQLILTEIRHLQAQHRFLGFSPSDKRMTIKKRLICHQNFFS